ERRDDLPDVDVGRPRVPRDAGQDRACGCIPRGVLDQPGELALDAIVLHEPVPCLPFAVLYANHPDTDQYGSGCHVCEVVTASLEHARLRTFWVDEQTGWAVLSSGERLTWTGRAPPTARSGAPGRSPEPAPVIVAVV